MKLIPHSLNIYSPPSFRNLFNDPLITKPGAQRQYQELYPIVFQPILYLERYYRAYYSLQKQADSNLLKVWQTLKSLTSYQNTIVLFFSDHGELLSSHGNSHQKWFNAYQESIHIPLIISSPLLGNKHRDVYEITSHVDILPTLLGLAGLKKKDQHAIRRELNCKFSLNLPLPGQNLAPYIFQDTSFPQLPLYFNTQDNPTQGPHQVNFLGQPYYSVANPASVEAVMIYYKNELWKLTHYYTAGSSAEATGITHELYNITQDPIEVNNLYDRPEYLKVQTRLSKILSKLAFKYNS